MREYSNRFATVEAHNGKFDCFNDVTGLFVKTVYQWSEASAFLQEQKQHYSAVERGRVPPR